MQSIQPLLAPIDVLSNTRLDERQVAKHIESFIQKHEGKVDENIHWEKAAFEFYPNYKNKETGWGTYFGPMYIWPNDKGQSMEYPSIQMLSEAVLTYYSNRAAEAQNPILIARYYGLVYDFYQRVTGKRTPYTIKTNYVQALLESANGGFYTVPIYVEKLRRSLEVALSIKNIALIQGCKDALIAFESKTAEDDLLGLWGYPFDLLLLKNRKQAIVSNTEEALILTDMIQRFERLLLSESDSKVGFRGAEHAATRLAKYYRTKGDAASKERYIDRLTSAIAATIQDKPSAGKAAAEYERLYNLCVEFGLRGKAKTYLLKIRELGRKAHDEMSVIRFEHSIERDKLAAFAAMIFKGKPADKIKKTAHCFIPDFNQIEKQVKADAK